MKLISKSCLVLVFVLAGFVASQAETAGKKLHLLIMGGQSNMVGMRYHDKTFKPLMAAGLAGDEIVTVGSASGGEPIRRWYKKWKPNGRDATEKEITGDMYATLIEDVKKRLGDRKPDTITFCWMQGESDAKKDYVEVYEKSFNGLMDELRKDLGRKDINFIIARISDNQDRKEWNEIRKIQVNLGKSDPNGAWIDTDNMNDPGNGLHYTVEGYNQLGTAFAKQALKMIKGDKPKTAL